MSVKIQYSLDPNFDSYPGYPISITCNGEQIFSDSGNRTDTNNYIYLLQALQKVLDFEIEDISPEWQRPKGTHEDFQSLIEWMKNYSKTHQTDWHGIDNSRKLLIGSVCYKNNILVNVRLEASPIPEEFITPENRHKFYKELNQMYSE